MLLLYLAVGGALGTVARYGLATAVDRWAGPGFPWGTLAVNVLGSLLIGFAIRILEMAPFSPEMRALITVGLLGAFTTFSTYTFETVALLRDGAWLRAGLYSVGSLVVGLAAVLVGIAAAEGLRGG